MHATILIKIQQTGGWLVQDGSTGKDVWVYLPANHTYIQVPQTEEKLQEARLHHLFQYSHQVLVFKSGGNSFLVR